MDTLKGHTATALLLFLLCIITASPAFAQVVPNIGDAVKQAAPPPQETPDRKEAPPAPVILEEGEKPFTLPEGGKIFIKEFELEGVPEGDITGLKELLKPYTGKELTLAQITEAANKVTLFYRDKGYLVAKAYVPKQDARDGILVIRVIMGAYGTFSLTNTSLVRDFFIQGTFEKAKDASKTVSRDGLERSILLVRDMPGAKIPTVSIAPGAQPGTSDFDVKVDRSGRFSGYVMGDNQGSKYTGRNRAYAGIDLNSPFGIADRLSVSAMSSDYSDLQSFRAAYGFPLSYSGLRGEVAVSRTIYELGGIYTDLDAKGQADILESTISYPLRRTGTDSMDLSLNIAWKKLRDDLNAVDSENPRDAAVATLALQRGLYTSLLGRNLFLGMSGSVNLGTLKINDDTQKALNDAGANTSGTYSKLNLALNANLDLTEKLSLRASAKVQKVLTSHNLDSTEQLFISGTAGVRAYTESVSFDNGYVVNAELRHALPAPSDLKHALGVFMDNGWVYAQDGDYTTDDKIMITDAGIGYYMSFKKLFGSIQFAYPIGRSSVSDPGTRGLAQVGFTF